MPFSETMTETAFSSTQRKELARNAPIVRRDAGYTQ